MSTAPAELDRAPRVPLHHPGEADLVPSLVADVRRHGAAACRSLVAPEQLDVLRALVTRALQGDDAWHRHDDVTNIGRVTFLPHYGREALELLEHPLLHGPSDAILGPECILYTMTTLCAPPGFAGRTVHVDRDYRPPGTIAGMGVMVLLDDFETEAGPTRIYPEVTDEPPSDEDFDRRAQVLEAPAGSVCWFDAGVWHDVLPNRSGRWRRAILIALVQPWMRQRFDMVRMVAPHGIDALGDRTRQKLGLLNLPPGSYEEFYLPEDVRREELLRRAIERAT